MQKYYITSANSHIYSEKFSNALESSPVDKHKAMYGDND